MSADLHLHTHYSDGTWSPQDLVDEAVRLGFNCIALTDHDSVSALAEASLHAGGRIRIINGIEINTIWLNPERQAQDVHILGYFIDPENQELKELIEKQQKARLEYLQEVLDYCRGLGFEIELAAVLALAGKGSPGKPHICKVLVERGVCPDLSSAYELLSKRKSGCPVLRRSVSPAQALFAIKAAGGIASLAHPGKDRFIPELLNELEPQGLSAIEAFHSGYSASLSRKYLKLANERKLLVTGGSDCHGPFEKYPASIGTVRLENSYLQALEQKLFQTSLI